MAEVPYQPYPDVQPAERVLRPGGVPEVPEAFGARVADAVQTFGGKVRESAGDVFQGALNLRKLQIEGKLRDLTTDYYNEAAPVVNGFLTKQGEGASQDAMNAHLAQLDQIGQKYTALAGQYGLYGINTFGADAAAMKRSFTREAITHSAHETIVAHDASINSNIATIHDQMRKGTISQEEGERQLTAAEQKRGGIYGSPANVVTQKAHDAISTGTTERAKGAILRDPENGAAVAQAALDSGKLNGKDSDVLVKSTQDAVYKTGPHQWYSRMMGGQDITLGEKKVSIDRLESAIWTMERHGRGPVVESDPYKGQQALPGGVMPGNLAPWLKEAGMSPMTEQQYIDSPAAQHQLMRFKLNQFQEQYGNANDAASAYFTGGPLTPRSIGASDHYHTNAWYIQGFNKALAKSSTQQELASAAEAHGNSIATTITPDAGEQYREFATRRWDQEKAQENFNDIQNLHTIDGSIGMVNPATGKLPTTPEELFTMNAANVAAYDGLPQVMKDRVGKALANNAYMIVPESPENRRLFREMVGKFGDPDTRTDAMYTLISSLPLTGPQQDKLNKIRDGILNRKEDTRIGPVMSVLQSTFGNAIPNRAKNPTAWQEFTGATQLWIEDHFNQFKKPPTPEEIREFGRGMIRDTSTFGGVFGVSRAYREAVPKEFHDTLAARYPGMPDTEIHNLYIETKMMQQFKDLHEQKKPAPSPTASVATPEVPISR